MKFDTLYKAYKKLTKKKYTTRADLARNCDFSVMTAGTAAKELLSLGIVFEKQLSGVGKLSAYDICYSVITADMNSIILTTFDKALKPICTHRAVRNYSFPLIEDISMFLNNKYSPCELFPCLFLYKLPENEIRIFSDLLPQNYAIIPDNTENIFEFMRIYMLKLKIEQKALAKEEEM